MNGGRGAWCVQGRAGRAASRGILNGKEEPPPTHPPLVHRGALSRRAGASLGGGCVTSVQTPRALPGILTARAFAHVPDQHVRACECARPPCPRVRVGGGNAARVS